MWTARLLDYKAFILRAAGIALIAFGLCLKGTFLLVQTFGTGSLLYIGAVTVGIPLLWLFWIGWKKGQSRWALFLCLWVGATFYLVVGRHWIPYLTDIVRDPVHADLADYVNHPGDFAILRGKLKYKVDNVLDTGKYFSPKGVKILVVSYGGAALVRVGNQACQSLVGKQQNCSFSHSGQLLLESKQEQSQVYIKIISPEP